MQRRPGLRDRQNLGQLGDRPDVDEHHFGHALEGGVERGVHERPGAGLWGFFSALLINAVARRRKIGADAAIGIVTTASFAIGVALISKTRSFTRDFEAALFGNVLGVTPSDLLVVGSVTIAVATFIVLFYKRLLFLTFDPDVAPIYGVRTGIVDSQFALAMAATIVASINVVGVTLIAATLVIPASTARLLTDSFARMILHSTALGAGLVGIYLSSARWPASCRSFVFGIRPGLYSTTTTRKRHVTSGPGCRARCPSARLGRR